MGQAIDIFNIYSKLHLHGGSDSDSREDDPPNPANDSPFEDSASGSGSEVGGREREESRDDGEEADVYEDDERDYSL